MSERCPTCGLENPGPEHRAHEPMLCAEQSASGSWQKYKAAKLRLRQAGARVISAATAEDFDAAVDAFMEAQIDWWNAIPRDTANTPIKDPLEALREAIELADEGWAYAGDYFQEKWDYVGQRNRLAALAGMEPITRAPGTAR